MRTALARWPGAAGSQPQASNRKAGNPPQTYGVHLRRSPTLVPSGSPPAPKGSEEPLKDTTRAHTGKDPPTAQGLRATLPQDFRPLGRAAWVTPEPDVGKPDVGAAPDGPAGTFSVPP